jgi:hypothetical protein
MFIIGTTRGFMVGLLAVAAGVGGAFGAGALGAASRGPAIGLLALGAVAWLFGRHEPERGQACSLFFIPLRLPAVVSLAAGALFLFVPGKDVPAEPKDPRLDAIEARLKSESVSGSGGVAAEKASSYQRAILGFEKIVGVDGKVTLHLDLDSPDAKSVKKAALYVQSSNLKKYGDENKKGLAALCLKMMRADFPQASCHVAARGPFLWGVQGSSAGAEADPVIQVTSDAPKFQR